MTKPFTAAIAGSLATVLLLGIAFASPQQPASEAPPKSITVKFEWIKTQPKSSDMLSVRVDNGQICTVTGQGVGGKGLRSISVTPIMVDRDTVTLDMDIQTSGSATDRIRTKVTMRLGETNVVSSAVTKSPSSKTEPNEELLFVTPN